MTSHLTLPVVGTCLAGCYWASTGFDVHPVQFTALLIYLIAMLIFIHHTTGTHPRKYVEPFAQNDLLSLPTRIRERITPGLDKVSSAFRGDDDVEEKEEGSDQQRIILLDAESMQLTETDEKTTKQIAKQYKSIDYLLCFLKHSDHKAYLGIMKCLRQ